MCCVNKIKISVIVPVYNTEILMLKKCFASLDSQTLKDIEIVIIDDGSCQNTADYCVSFANSHDKFVYYRQNNSGVSVARNKGIDLSKGQFITFVDSDDWLEKDTLLLLYNEAVNSKSDIVLYDIFLDYRDEIVKNTLLESDFKENISVDELQKRILYINFNGVNVYGIVVGKLYRNAILKENNIFFPIGISMSEDQIFALKAFQFSKNISMIKGNFYHYVIHQKSICNRYNKKFDYVNLMEQVYNELFKIYDDFHKDNDFCNHIYLKMFKLISVILTKHIFNINSDLKMRDQIKELKVFLEHDIVSDIFKNVKFYLLNKRELFMYFLIKLHMYWILGFSIHYKQAKNIRKK